LGTKFSVRRDEDRVEVVVLEGRVQIDDISPSFSEATFITRGDIATASNSTLRATRSEEQAVDELS
jgi:transmembrane sensor